MELNKEKTIDEMIKIELNKIHERIADYRLYLLNADNFFLNKLYYVKIYYELNDLIKLLDNICLKSNLINEIKDSLIKCLSERFPNYEISIEKNFQIIFKYKSKYFLRISIDEELNNGMFLQSLYTKDKELFEYIDYENTIPNFLLSDKFDILIENIEHTINLLEIKRNIMRFNNLACKNITKSIDIRKLKILELKELKQDLEKHKDDKLYEKEVNKINFMYNELYKQIYNIFK